MGSSTSTNMSGLRTKPGLSISKAHLEGPVSASNTGRTSLTLASKSFFW